MTVPPGPTIGGRGSAASDSAVHIDELGVLRRGGYTGARLLELAPRDGFRRERWEDELALGHRVLSSG